MSLICMMCSRTPLTLMIQMEENFIIRVLAKALSEVMNCSSCPNSDAGEGRKENGSGV